MLFINTRPRDRAQHLTTELKKKQIDVLDLPLLELSALPFDSVLNQQFLSLSSVDIIVVVSPTAAQIGLQYLNQCHLSLETFKQIHWVAVGEKTADVLRKVGLNPHVPVVETSEGMLDLPILKQVKVQHVAFWRGIGGRQFMMNDLASKQIKISNFLLYQRDLPAVSQQILDENFSKIQRRDTSIYVCISSEASWLNWKKLCQHHLSFIHHCYYLTLGTRLTEILTHEVDKNYVYQIDNLYAETIYQMMSTGQKQL